MVGAREVGMEPTSPLSRSATSWALDKWVVARVGDGGGGANLATLTLS